MTPRERLFALEQHGIKLGLDNITTLVHALDRPDRDFPSIHIAGTNGKGSVSAMVERGLRAAGYRTGRYTSPHLFAIEERVAVDGEPIDSTRFDDAAAEVLSVIDGLLRSDALPQMPTFFEATTAIAFLLFRRAGVSAAIIEVGLGGRFDATNVIAPRLTAITSIDFDHERYLGRTLREIAFEKAGIIKPGVPVVVGAMAEDPRRVIEDAARISGAPLIDALPSERGTAVPLALPGLHQAANAAVAVALLRCWSAAEQNHDDAIPVDRSAIVAALTDVDWPARLEWLRLPSGGTLLLDAAHNPAGARALAHYVLAHWAPMPLIFGVMRDKEIEAMLRELAPAVTRVLTVTADSPRAMSAADLAAQVRRLLPATPCDAFNDTAAAVTSACTDNAQAMCAGSIFLVGPLRNRLLSQGAVAVRYPAKATPFYLD